MAACTDLVEIPADEARKLGVAKEIVDALEAAKRPQK